MFTPVAWLGSVDVGGPTAIARAVIAVNKHPQYNPASNGVRISFSIYIKKLYFRMYHLCFVVAFLHWLIFSCSTFTFIES